jgi:PAS domain S-box-containing protein
MKIGVRITIAFVLGLLIIGAVGIQSYLGIQQLTERNRWVMQTHEVLENLERVLSVLKDAETGQRGFVLTGEDRYLEPYNAAAGEIVKDIDSVTSLTKDNPEQQKSLQQLQKLSRDKLDELQETIKLRREAGLEAALPVIRSDRGKRIMDEIRVLIDQMAARERRLLDARNRAAGEVARRSMLTLGFGVLLSLGILGGAAVIIIRTMQLADRGTLPGGAGRKWPRIAIRYAFAVVVVALVTGLRSWLVRFFGPMPLFVTWYPAVLLVATIAGGGPGVVATLLSAMAADYWFIEPLGQFGIGEANEAVAMGIFTGTGIFLSILAERLRRARWAEAVSVTQERELALLNMANLMTLDLDHRIVHWREGNRRLYGFNAQEAQGQLTFELLQTHLPQPLEQIHSELLETGHWEGEATRRSKDGTQLSLAILWAMRRDERGKPLAILEVSTDITRQKIAEESLRQQSEELAQQNEQLTQQSEELTQQAEELSEQNEELQTQSEEIQALNADLGRREKMLQTLLESARLPIGEQEVMGKICRAAMEMIGQPATGVVVCEQHGDELQILAHTGFDGAEVPGSWPVKGSFIEMVIQQNRTASLEDTSLRPDLNILNVPDHQRFAAVLSSPVHVNGKGIGAVSIYSNKTQRWTAEQFGLVEWLATHCSNTLEAMRLAAEVRGAGEQRRLALEAAELGAWDYRFDAGRVYWDERCRDMWGIPKGETIDYDAAIDRIHPEDRLATDEAVKQALAGAHGGAYHREFRVLWPDGSVHWIASHGRVYFEGEEADRRAVQFIGANRDITQEKQAQEAIRESQRQNEFLANILEASSQAFGVGYPDGRLGLTNKAFEQITGYSGEELRSIDRARTLTPPEWLEIERQKLDELHRTGLPVRYEKEYIRKDGTRVPIELLVHLVKDAEGKPLYYYSFLTDITERRKAEEALREAHEDLERRVQERTTELIQINRTLRMVSACNESVVRAVDEVELMTDVCRIIVEIGGYRMAWVGFAEDDPQQSVRPVASMGFEEGYLKQAGICWADNERGRGPTGTAIRLGSTQICSDFLADPRLAPWRERAVSCGFQSSIALPLVHDGRAFGALTIYAAMPHAFRESATRVLEEMAGDLAFGIMALRTRKELRESHDRLHALASELTLAEQRERKQLAQVLHDHIQQLLVGAKFRLAILGRTDSPALQKAAGDVDDLLTEAIKASRSLTAELSPPILHEAGLAAALEWLARWMKENYDLIVSVNADMRANPGQEALSVLIFQSIRELLFNTVKHAKVERARVDMSLKGTQLEVIVSDEGEGFDPAQVLPLKTSSAGFGLFSIRERLNLLGGSMTTESAPGQGCRVILVAPLQSAGVQLQTAPSRRMAAERGQVSQRGAALEATKKIRVLLADDHVVMRDGLSRLLKEEADFEIVGLASDGQAAIDLARRLLPDVIVMDIRMPQVTGIEATRLIRAELPQVQVIGLSMFEEPDQAARMREAGASDYLLKSGQPAALIAAIRECMGRKSGADHCGYGKNQ